LIGKPLESHRVATDRNAGIIDGAGSFVVRIGGVGGCDSASIIGLANRSLVAYRDE
jgi:hypothetical protein